MRRRNIKHFGSLSALRALALSAVILLAVTGCRIEPPLHLPSDGPQLAVYMAHVETRVSVVWDIDADWEKDWWYGWDDKDSDLFGPIEYPMPTYFEARMYYFGEQPADQTPEQWIRLDRMTVYDTHFRRQFDFGMHNMLIWSNIDSKDGTQVLIVNEDDPSAIFATTSRSRLSYGQPSARSSNVFNNPEIFYAGGKNGFTISRDTADYDYFDPLANAWVLNLDAELTPLVYIYLVQVAVYNNNGRITGLTDNAAVNSMADGVNIHTGQTSNSPVAVAYPMRLKKDLPARDGKPADIFGGKLTTFGLCDMAPWRSSRGAVYRGSRSDLDNHLMLNFTFDGRADSTYTFRITDQMQRQAHGGVITIEIDADTLRFPQGNGTQPGSGFDAVIVDREEEEHEFDM